jgi:hypothetical protein
MIAKEHDAITKQPFNNFTDQFLKNRKIRIAFNSSEEGKGVEELRLSRNVSK